MVSKRRLIAGIHGIESMTKDEVNWSLGIFILACC